MEHTNFLSMVLLGAVQFLGGGWWTIHIVAIIVVGFIGYKVGRMKES